MKLRTVYLKVGNMNEAAAFWQQVLERAPQRQSPKWTEFLIGDVRLGLLLNDFGDDFDGSGAVPVFEFEKDALLAFLDRAKANGAKVVVDGLDDPNMKSIVLRSPDGHEFELCTCHE
jgi:catechol 2,3-dioxygenase-like lactoylglutathione lyase family enzyme